MSFRESHGYQSKILVDVLMPSIPNDSYNVDWWVSINIFNTTDPKPCFGYDQLGDTNTRITIHDMTSYSSWSDDGRSMNWKLNGNALPGWHTVRYMNLTHNATFDRLQSPYYLHYPFVSNQASWQRAFYIDDIIDYDYTQIEFDVFSFCGWDPATDRISVTMAFQEYLDFGAPSWTSTHAVDSCDGYDSLQWDSVLDVVRKNNGTHSDISCYAEGMTSPSYECSLNVATQSLAREEDVNYRVDCAASDGGNVTARYYKNGGQK